MEPDGFRAFVAARSPALLRTAWMLTGDTHLAEDLLQSSLARVWPRWTRIRDEQPEAYVRKVMVRRHVAMRKRRWWGELSVTGQADDAAPGSPDAVERVDDRDALRRALLRLPIRQRQVVVLRYYEDLSEAQVASILGCSVGTVKSQAARGLAKLRVVMDAPAALGGRP